MEERYITAIDLGTSKIALTVARIEGDDVQIVYYRETPSDGIRYSRVNNPAKAANSIKLAVETAEAELNIKCRQVVVGLPKYEVRQENGSYSIPRSEEVCVTTDDIEDLKRCAQDSYVLANPEKEMLFGAVAQSFNDGSNFQIVENDIIGMTMKELEGNFKLFIGQSKYVNDIDIAFQRAGEICVSRKYFTPDAIAKAVLYDSEMENGVALIDFGAGVTSVSIYYGSIMRHYAAIPFGGKSITSDIKSICAITDKLAENIKLAYGACMPDKLQNMGDKTLVLTSEADLPSKQVPVNYISQIITARATEIIEALLYEIQCSGFADNLRGGVVITGGGSNLANITTLIKELSGYNVRVGYPKRVFSGADDFDTGATASIGMILMAKAEKGLNCPIPSADEPEPEPGSDILDDDTVFSPAVSEEEKKSKKEKKNKKGKGPKGGNGTWKALGSIFNDIANEKV